MSYAELLEAAKRDPDSVDFRELRLACAKTDDYNPYYLDDKDASSINDLMEQGDMAGAAQQVNQLLEANYLDIQWHIAAAAIYHELGDGLRTDYHKRFAFRLLDSILDYGDGKTPETAFIVINVGEEYAVLRALRLELKQQSLIELGGHSYDQIDGIQPDTGETCTLYFNIDLPFSTLSHISKPAAGSGYVGEERKKWWRFWKK